MKALLLAAGLGTRLQPFTLHHPKALALVNGKSLLERNIVYLQQQGITEVIVNVHHFAKQIIDAVESNNGWGSKVSFSDETDQVLETGGGLKRASWYFKGEESLVMMNVDILTNMALTHLIDAHLRHNPLATLAITNRVSNRSLVFNNDNELCGWRNTSTLEEKGPLVNFTTEQKQQLTPKAFSGIHVLNTDIFKLITQEGKFSIIDVYMSTCGEYAIKGYDHSDTLLIDVGKPERITKAEEVFK